MTTWNNPMRFDLSPEEILSLSTVLIADYKKGLDAIGAVAPGTHTFANTIKAFTDNEVSMHRVSQNCEFPSNVSVDKAVRDASTTAEKSLSELEIECWMREDVYTSLKAYAALNEPLSPVDQRILDRTLQKFRRAGMELPESERARVMSLQKQISELCIEFQRTLNEDTSQATFTTEELAGVPEDLLKSFKLDADGKHIVTMKYPDVFPALKYCTVVETRRTLERVYSSRCMAENGPRLLQIVALRHEVAQLKGYATHGHFVLEPLMAKTPETVSEFLADMARLVAPVARADLAALKAIKAKATGEADPEIHPYDYGFYSTRRLEQDYDVDETLIKQYFPLETVTAGLLDIYQSMLMLQFEKVENPAVWHPDVTMYAVHDAAESKEFMGYFYLDLFPRDGKFGHACACGLVPTYLIDGVRQPVVAAMLANFSKPTPEQPSLLRFSEVTTFFHEFGHLMHGLCSQSPYSRFSGTSVERDFVEAPSQMLENWCFEAEALEKMSGHYERPHERLPAALAQKLAAAKNANIGISTGRQLMYGTFDSVLHSASSTDVDALWSKLSSELFLIPPTEGTRSWCTFGHLAGGYDSAYYSYMYSEVFSADMFARFKKEGITNPTVGKLYRDVILAPGGSRDSLESLKIFLGRSPNSDAFIEGMGLKA